MKNKFTAVGYGARLAAADGRTGTPAKAAASGENGKRGGRPRKTAGAGKG